MTKNILIPAIEGRLQSYLELSRRSLMEREFGKDERRYPTVTLTREFGCEGYPVAERLQSVLEKRTGRPWVVMDRALLEVVAKEKGLPPEVLHDVGLRNRILDEILSTFSSRWKSDKDYYRLLARQIVTLAEQGNVILVGRGASILTQETGNCFHFRLIAPLEFKVASISARMGLSTDEARDFVEGRQRQRDAFLKDFLGRDIGEPTLYHLIFNNARCTATRIAELMAEVIVPGGAD
jgi:cytidylate kinase